MIVVCPKCQFRQPMDRYCANCGVDLELQLQQQPPPKVKITGSSAFYIVLFAVFVLATSYYVSNQITENKKTESFESSARSKILDTVTDKTKKELAAVSAVSQATPSNALPSTTGAPAAPQIPSAATEDPINPQTAGFSAKAETLAGRVKQTDSKIIEKESEIKIYFAEVTEQGLGTLFEGGAPAVGSQEVGAVANFSTNVEEAKKNQAIKILDLSLHKIKPNMQPLVLFRGGKDPRIAEPVGFMIQLVPGELSSEGLQVSIQVQRTLAEGEADIKIDKQEFRDSGVIGKGGAIFFSGMLPHKKPTAFEQGIFTGNVLSVFKSSLFQNKRSELMIFVELTRLAKELENN